MHQHLQHFIYLPSGHQSSPSHRYKKHSPFPSSLSTFMEYYDILPSRPNLHQPNPDSVHNHDEVSIRIIGATEQDNHREEEGNPLVTNDGSVASAEMTASPSHDDVEGVLWSGSGNFDVDADDGGKGVGSNGRDYSYQRYDIQHAVRWIEQVLPFSLLLLVVFIRQHLQVAGFFVTIWITAVLFKLNDILRKQTTVKGEMKMPVLIGIFVAFALRVVGVYWWYQNDDLMYPLVMLPPKGIPSFWHAIFIIIVNDTLVRQAAMIFKCILLMYYKNSGGRNYRKQGKMLTLVEYLLLLYRALLPMSIWYCFFLNKEYGSLFSSLMIGLYLTFKLTSVVEKVQSFFTVVKALSRKEVHYGAHATSEQENEEDEEDDDVDQ